MIALQPGGVLVPWLRWVCDMQWGWLADTGKDVHSMWTVLCVQSTHLDHQNAMTSAETDRQCIWARFE